MQSINHLLVQIKYFLSKNTNIEGAYLLLKKVDYWLQRLHQQPIKEVISKYEQKKQRQQTSEQILQQLQDSLFFQQQLKQYQQQQKKSRQIYEKMQKYKEQKEPVSQINMPKQQLKQLNLNKKVSSDFQILIDQVDQEQVVLNIGLCVVQPRKFANLLDVFILDYNFESAWYQIVPFTNLHEKEPDISNDRRAILQLLLGSTKDHIIQKQKTQSMTQLHKLTANVSRSSSPLILPNYSTNLAKYIYIYETKQCMEFKEIYYLADRYYCFVVDGLAVNAVDQLFKSFKSRVFQQRILKVQTPLDVNYNTIRKYLIETIPFLIDQVNQTPLSIGNPPQYEWLEKQIQFKVKSIRTNVLSSLMFFFAYLALCQFKIVLVVGKEQKNLLSQVLISLEGAIRPFTYVFPVVFCTLTKQHLDFVQSPVPLTIGFWGSDKRRQKFNKQFDAYLKQNKLTNTIGIDLDKRSIISQVGLTNKDLYVIQKANKYIKKYGKGACLWQKISSFLGQIVEQINKEKSIVNFKRQKSDWMQLLEQKIRLSQMHHIYKNN